MTDYMLSKLATLGGVAAADEFPLVDVSDTSTAPAGPGGSDKVVPAVQLAAQLRGLATGMTAGSAFQGLWTAIANRNSARVDIPVIGDSITGGFGATQYANTWVQQANKALRAAYPTANGANGGLGFIPVLTAGNVMTWPITSTVQTANNIGPARDQPSFAQAGQGFTFTAPPGTTSVRVMYLDSTNAGTFTYKVGSGGTTTVTNAGTGKDILTASIPISGGQLLTVAWASGSVYLDGLVHFAGDEGSGITLHPCGRPGWCAGNEASTGWQQAAFAGINWQQSYANGFPTVPPAFAVMLGVNDSSATGGNRTAAQFQADLAGLIASIRGGAAALANLPVIIIAPYGHNATYADPGGWPAYVAAMRTVAAADPVGAVVIDLSYLMSFPAATGPLQYDSWHPNDLGHAYVGSLVAGALEPFPVQPAAPLMPTAEPLAAGEAIAARTTFTAQPAPVSGTLHLAGWTAATPGTATSVTLVTGGTAGAGLTYAAVGVYSVDANGNGTLVASTGDVHATAFTSAYHTTTLSLGSGFTRVPGQRYMLGLLVTGTTPPSVYGCQPGAFGLDIMLPQACMQLPGQAALPATVTASGLSAGSLFPAAAVVP